MSLTRYFGVAAAIFVAAGGKTHPFVVAIFWFAFDAAITHAKTDRGEG